MLAEDVLTATIGRLTADLSFLADDEQEGRDVGSDGIARAAELIAGRFAELGLEVDSFDGTPFQDFTIPGPAEAGAADQNTLTLTSGDESIAGVLGEDFTPLSLGSSGKFDGPLVFAGYGITAPELDYDDYDGLDVEGRVVVVLRKEPGQNDPDSKFDGKRNSQYAYFSSKELNAAVHKVGALILVNDSQTVKAAGGEDRLLTTTAAGRAVSSSQVPTLYCSRSLIDPLVKQATGRSLQELEAEIDSDGQPRSQPLGAVSASGETLIEQSKIPVRNVVGFLPGRGPLAEEYVVVGAHYDHVGMGGAGSLAPGTTAVHNGADDNASGTATLLEVARRLSADQSESRRGLIFIAFTGEEKGLLGSKHYVRNPRWPLENTVAMVNMDMVGRLNENTLIVFGIGTAESFDSLVERLNETAEFNLDKRAAGFGPSDHSSFYEADIPVFHFFTGLHNDYHRPSDDVERVDFVGMARIATMVSQLVAELVTAEQRPRLLKSSAVAQVGRRSANRPRRGSRAVLGVSLDLSSGDARVAQVAGGGPGAEAGLVAGDRIIKIDEQQIASIEDLRAVMRSKKPGDKVLVTIERESEAMEIEVKLGEG